MRKKARYPGGLIRELIPNLYGRPVYDKKFIPYRVVIPKMREVTVKELIDGYNIYKDV